VKFYAISHLYGIVKIVELISGLAYCSYTSDQFYLTFKKTTLPEIHCARFRFYRNVHIMNRATTPDV